MYYKKFIISNYKAIRNPLVVELNDGKRYSPIPIIGVNECGKTSILEAIFAFDYNNDKLNKGRHLGDLHNLYTVDDSVTPCIEAKISLSIEEFRDILERKIDKKPKQAKNNLIDTILQNFNDELHIKRYLVKNDESYYVCDRIQESVLADEISRELILKLPFILYFDDFQDSLPDVIDLNNQDTNDTWINIVEELFKTTSPSRSVFSLKDRVDNIRTSWIHDVEAELKDKISQKWEDFKKFIEPESGSNASKQTPSLKITLNYSPSDNTLKFGVDEEVEIEGQQRTRNFKLKQRSKGFYWFFNFVMKLYYNPKKRQGNSNDTIYLLDEPGSYLHTHAQTKLCEHLKELSDKNYVIYTTHSHYLLDPKIIPLKTIRIARKDHKDGGIVTLNPVNEFYGNDNNIDYAIKPILDALMISPIDLQIDKDIITLLTEGIFDYYAFTMFKQDRKFAVFPAKDASSIIDLIPILIGFGIEYRALWDNDVEGRTQKSRAEEFYDEYESKYFYTLSLKTKTPVNMRMEELFDQQDITLIKNMLGTSKESFKKVIAELFYSSNREEIINSISSKTKDNFNYMFDQMSL